MATARTLRHRQTSFAAGEFSPSLYGRTDFHPETMLARYHRHNAEVQDYFRNRSDDLLVMDMSRGAGWPELCGFLGKPIPDIPYPHSHKDQPPTEAR